MDTGPAVGIRVEAEVRAQEIMGIRVLVLLPLVRALLASSFFPTDRKLWQKLWQICDPAIAN